MRASWAGLARMTLTVGVVGGLLLAASGTDATLDLTRFAPAPVSPADAAAGAPTKTSLTCPGPQLQGLREGTNEPQSTLVTAGQPSAAMLADGAAADAPQSDLTLTTSLGGTPVTTTDTAASTTVTEAGSVTVTGRGERASALAAYEQWTLDTKGTRGLGTTACAHDGDDLWFIAGGGDAGRQERLVLANSGANELSADITVYGTQGQITAPNGRGIVVPGKGRTVVLLDALAPGEPAPVVHVTTRGGAVAASLLDLWVDGATPAGADAVSATPPPATRQVIPALWLTQPGVVRVGVPGDTQAVVSVRALTADGAAPLPGGGVARIAAKSTQDLPVKDLPPGTYGLVVDSDAPIVAGAFTQARSGSAPGDFAWSSAAPALTTIAGMPLAPLSGGQRWLVLAASGGNVEAQVVTGSGSGSPSTVTVGADRIVVQELGAGAGGVWVRPTSAVGGESGSPSGNTPGSLYAAVVSGVGSDSGRLMSVLVLNDTVTVAPSTRVQPLP